eukprot:CAMPEP_0183375554 /NCGR_PEP_ID=MMETSP0164_2-20130417/117703_1 /TAXON_ID=221442 /ORGANISM="Coccolithus pelagicus ssp braarudi, Strain PLY182g" /LENGTH=104 /DNA_ID=CAMNT_0025552729 /DNA_START=95 /DNA_END=406 /DNA_ORIENTATION=+
MVKLVGLVTAGAVATLEPALTRGATAEATTEALAGRRPGATMTVASANFGWPRSSVSGTDATIESSVDVGIETTGSTKHARLVSYAASNFSAALDAASHCEIIW